MKRYFFKLITATSVGLALSLSLSQGTATLAQQPTEQPAQQPTEQPAQQTIQTVSDPLSFITAYGEALSNPQLIEGFTQFLTEDVTWRIAGDRDRLWYPGEYQGRTRVQDFFINITRTFIWTEFTPLDVLQETRTNSETGRPVRRVAVRVAQTGKGTFTGRAFRGDFVYLFTINEAGQVQSFEGFYNTYPAAAAATGVEVPPAPLNDALTGKAIAPDATVDPAMARRVATALWQALIANDLPSASGLNAAHSQWSFAIGGPNFLPFVGAAQGMTTDEKPLKADFSNAGAIITQILQPRTRVVSPGNLRIQETLVNGNRVFVHLRETGAIALETGNRYDLDVFSWLTVNRDGKVTSHQVITDTYATVAALRSGSMFPLPASALAMRHYPASFVTGSRVNGIVVAYDAQGGYKGILGQADPTDSTLQQPSAITFGRDGNVYVTSSDTTDRTQGNNVLIYDGVSGQFRGVFGQANAQSGLLNPTGIKFGPDDNLYVASGYTSQVLRYNGKTGAFMGVYATRNNGFPNNLVPQGMPSDFTVLVFGPDGDLYVTSLLENNLRGAVLRYAGPLSAKPGQFRGIYGQASSASSELNQPRSIVFGPDANLYVASAATGRVLQYAGPYRHDAGRFMGVYADVGREIIAERDIQNGDFNGDGTADMVVQNGLGFGPDKNLYVSSTIEYVNPEGGPGNPIGGSQVRIYAGPHHRTPGTFLGVFGQASTEDSRILLPTTPEFTYEENTFPQINRFKQIAFVVGSNTDRPLSAEGEPGFFQSDTTDALAAYDQNMKFLGFLNENLLGSQNPINGIGGVVMGPSGHILLSSQHSDQILQFNSLTGAYMGVFGDASPQGTGDDPKTSENEGLDFPAGLTVGPDNNLYVSDLGNKRIFRFDGYTGRLLDDPNTPQNEGIVVQLSNADDGRFTDLAFGPDGRIYIGFNLPRDKPALGRAEVRVYRPDGGLEMTIKGPPEHPLDFVAVLDVGPDRRLYVGDDPASVADPATGQLLAPDRQSRLLIYEIPNVHPLLVNPKTGQGDPNGVRQPPHLIREFEVGQGNAGGLTVDTNGVIYLSAPWAGEVRQYNDTGELLGTVANFRLPTTALRENGGVDEDGRPRPTGSVFITRTQ